jgi:glycosyltransferase involved in cell wall biosynthesis
VKSPHVSVIVPAYRAARTIRRALDSVLSQTVPAAEIIVVDDGSPDDQAAVVAGYGDRVRLIRKANGGAASARNAGIETACGDFLAFLDADDYWEPVKLERQLSVFQRHSALALVAGRYFEERPGKLRMAPSANNPQWYDRVLTTTGEAAFRMAMMVWTGTVIIRHAALGQERFVSGLEPAEDRDLWVRVTSRHSCYLISEPLTTAVLECGSLSRTNVDRDCGNMLRVITRHRHLIGPVGHRLWKSNALAHWAARDDCPRTALPRLIRSFVLWPLPYPNAPWFCRMQRFAVLVMRWLRREVPSAGLGGIETPIDRP